MSLPDDIQQVVDSWPNREATLQMYGIEARHRSRSSFYNLLNHLLYFDKFGAGKVLKKQQAPLSI